ncbi:hypothetical protein G9A89_023548 [Geosiphon pyriformis]|nr:hypothetical protein G9A89_023548 [Geosiphon pyriformis]
MDLETASSGSMSSKKAPKSVFYSSAGGFFSQRKKVPLGNVKHSGDKKNISLKSGSGASIYSNVESLSGDDKDANMSGGFDGSLLDLAIDKKVKPLLPPLKKKVLLEKIWIDPKIIKTSVEVSVKKSFALDINFLAVEENLAMSKTQFIRKIFSKINGFGGATTPSKFEKIIRSIFTSEKNIEVATLLARKNKIIVNTNLKKSGMHSDRAIVIKEIPMDTPKDMIIAAVAEFDEIRLIRVVCCAVVGFKSEKNLDTAFHTKPIFGGTQLSWARLDLVKCEKCECSGHLTLKCDASVASSSELSSSFKKPASGFDCFQLAKLYVVSLDSFSGGSFFGFGLLSGGPPLSLGSSSPQVDGLGEHLAVLECSLKIFSDQVSVILKKLSFIELVLLVSPSCVSSLAVSVPLALVVDSDMALNSMLASPAPLLSNGGESADGLSSNGLKILTSKMGSLKSKLFVPIFVIPMSGLIWKFATCNVWGINVPTKQTDIVHWHVSSGNMVFFVAETKLRSSFGLWIKNKFDGVRIFTSGLDIGYLGTGIAVIMDNSLARHVSRVKEVSGRLILIWLLFKGKLSVTILGLYAGASSGTRFAQAPAVNFLIAKAVNSNTFVVLGGDFNKNDFGRSANFKFCLGLGLVNSFAGYSLVKTATWSNSKGMEKTIDFIFVSGTLSSAVIKHCVNSVSDFFDTDHKSVMVLVGLGGLLDVRLNGLCKQANKDCWKFRIKDADGAGWFCFKDCSSVKMLEVKGRFLGAAAGLDLDAIWSLLEKVVVDSADKIFSRHWFCDFQCLKNKHSSKFLGLELLVAKIVKCLTSANTSGFNQFVRK